MAALRSLLLVAAVSAAVTGTALGWWCNGHMLVATIAQSRLTPKAAAAINPLISEIANYYPTSPDFVTSACWADDLKSQGVEANAEWHFINLAYVRNPLYTPGSTVRNVSNVAWAITESNNTCFSEKATTLDKARFLRFLIHFIGDIHQPLHSATQYDQALFPPPGGDEGGNKVPVQGVNQTNLHFFWDSGAGQWEGDLTRPLSTTGVAWLNQWANDLTSNYPESVFTAELAQNDPYLWAGESYNLAVTFAYTTGYNATIAPEYIQKARGICQSQVALGGYRLAQTLNAVFD